MMNNTKALPGKSVEFPARKQRMVDDATSLETLSYAVFELDNPDTMKLFNEATEALDRIENLLEDVGLDPDRNYSVLDVQLIRAAIEQVLGGKL